MARELSPEDLAYEAISDQWELFIDLYDTNRRREVLIYDFLGKERITGKRILEVGAGLGHFTETLLQANPCSLTCVDISARLVQKLRESFPSVRAVQGDVMNLSETIGEQFDLVICSEVIEHTPDPFIAVRQLCGSVSQEGLLVLSTPNIRWKWLLHLAHALGLRKHYRGYENWMSPDALLEALVSGGFAVERREGIHVLPWHVCPKTILRMVDVACRTINYPFAVNLAVLARRLPSAQEQPFSSPR
jgi:2-polyprenyl-3-methyl-5-hydroxy-6-metoxy-1,4-benzoquinol methylase